MNSYLSPKDELTETNKQGPCMFCGESIWARAAGAYPYYVHIDGKIMDPRDKHVAVMCDLTNP